MKYNDKLVYLREFYNNNNNICPHTLLRLSFLTIDEIRSNLNHRQNVMWAYKCASSVQHTIKSQKVRASTSKCLHLTKQWLHNEKSVTKEQLYNAADSAAHYAAHAAHAAHSAAHYAILAAHAARAAHSAAHYAILAAHAALAAHYAAHYAILAAPNRRHQEALNLHYLIETALDIHSPS